MRRTLLTLLLLALAGCASIAEDSLRLKTEHGSQAAIANLEAHLKQHPDDIEARALLARYREQWVQEQVNAADELRTKNPALASEQFQRILAIDPGNARASAGLARIAQQARHRQWLTEAQTAWRQQQAEAALAALSRILNENPADATAQELKAEIDRERTREALIPAKLKKALQKPVTLEFRDQNLRSIFEALSRSANINFIFDKDTPADLRATIFARNTPVESALKLLLATNRLEKKVLNDNTLLIYANTPDKQRDYQEMVMRTFYLSNADVNKTLNMIKLMLKTQDVYVDERLNMIIMRDTPEIIRVAEKLIAAQDVPDPEVLLDLEVLEVYDGFDKNLGISYPTSLGFGIIPGTTTSSSGTTTSSSISLDTLHHLNASGIGVTGLALTDPALKLNLKSYDNDTKTLANPRIRVKNKEKAKVLIGEKVPIFTTSTTNTVTSSSVQYQDVGLTLNAEPLIHADGNVSVKLTLEVSSLGAEVTDGSASGAKAFRINTRRTETALRLKDGETQVLAGLIRNEERNSYLRVPGLGDIPILGRLFGNTGKGRDHTEIVLKITPHVVRNLERPESTVTEFMSGTTTQMSDGNSLRLDPASERISNTPAAPGEFTAPIAPAAPVAPANPVAP